MATEQITSVVENWKAIEGFPGYEVSDLGNVRSLRRLTTNGKVLCGRLLRPYVSGNRKSHSFNRPQVNLHREAKQYTRYV